MTVPLKCALVGCGSIAQVHARALSEMPEARLLAFADLLPERAQAMAEKYGGKAYGSLDELLTHEQIDVLHLCTPHYLHTPMAQQAADLQINVFTEKPPVIDRDQWAQFNRLEDKVRVGICFQNRYNGSTRALKALLDSGEAGEVLGSRGFVTWRRDAAYYTESGWRGALATEGGGALINQAIHTLDLMAYLLGPGQVLGASLSNRHLKGVIEVEDTLEAALDFGNKRGLFYAATDYSLDAPILFELSCENATLRLEGERFTRFWRDGRIEQEDYTAQDPTVPGKAYWGSSHRRCIEDFYRCVQSGRRFMNDISGVSNTVELMLSLYEAARGK